MEEIKYRCGICGKRFEDKHALRNEVNIANGEWHFSKYDVCDSCAKKIGEFVKELGGELVVNRPEETNQLKTGNQ